MQRLPPGAYAPSPDDIAKTVFRMHHVHFQFMVMAFGLINNIDELHLE